MEKIIDNKKYHMSCNRTLSSHKYNQLKKLNTASYDSIPQEEEAGSNQEIHPKTK